MTRRSVPDDLPAIAETLALAFYDDPVWGWAYPDPERRLEQHRAVWGLLAETAVAAGSAWQTPVAEAVAIWVLPGRAELAPEGERRLEAMLEGWGAERAQDTIGRFEAAHPGAPDHHYLSLLATHPDHRGRGVGMGLLATCLDRIDADPAPAFLESTNPANDSRYECAGFARSGEFGLSEGGPTVTQMWREPR